MIGIMNQSQESEFLGKIPPTIYQWAVSNSHINIVKILQFQRNADPTKTKENKCIP